MKGVEIANVGEEAAYKDMWLKLKAALERRRESEGADAEYCLRNGLYDELSLNGAFLCGYANALVMMERIEKGEEP